MASPSLADRLRARLQPRPAPSPARPETPSRTLAVETVPRVDDDAFDAALEKRIRAGFLETYLTKAKTEWLESEAGRAEVRREIVEKYEQCRRYVVPWVDGVAPLAGRSMIEIGCGTGAKAAAFASEVASVRACDVSPAHLEAARRRVNEMGLANVALEVADAATFLDRLEADPPEGGVDLCLLFAVLEHMTLEERLDTLRRAWALLEPGGVLVVLETPNRLLPWDWHGSRLPFFSMLPDDLALLYFDRSPRPDYVANVALARDGSLEEQRLALTREGRGISYHDFAVALGDGFGDDVIADSWDQRIVALNPIERDELDLVEFIVRDRLDVPAAFTRYWIQLVLQKSGPGAPRAAATPLGLPRPLRTEGSDTALLNVLPEPRTLAVEPDAHQVVLVTHSTAPATVIVDDDQGGRAELAVPAGYAAHTIALDAPAAITIRTTTANAVTLVQRFSR